VNSILSIQDLILGIWDLILTTWDSASVISQIPNLSYSRNSVLIL